MRFGLLFSFDRGSPLFGRGGNQLFVLTDPYFEFAYHRRMIALQPGNLVGEVLLKVLGDRSGPTVALPQAHILPCPK
mgnify:CR=1 FL=1